MSEKTDVAKTETTAITIRTEAKALDKVANDFTTAMAGTEHQFEMALITANAMKQLQDMLTDEVMTDIMTLQNSRLGFLTDKDPSKPQWKNGQQIIPKPYAVETVKRCLIEATLTGLKPVGNQFNIISGSCYATKEGFAYLLKNLPGLTDLKENYDVPVMKKEQGATVHCTASWNYNGNADSIECTIPIRVNKTMGADAILGKTERKLKARIFNRITGSELSSADASDPLENAHSIDAKDVDVGTARPMTVPPQEKPEEKPEPELKVPEDDNAEQRAELLKSAEDFNILDIDPSWDNEQIRAHIHEELDRRDQVKENAKEAQEENKRQKKGENQKPLFA